MWVRSLDWLATIFLSFLPVLQWIIVFSFIYILHTQYPMFLIGVVYLVFKSWFYLQTFITFSLLYMLTSLFVLCYIMGDTVLCSAGYRLCSGFGVEHSVLFVDAVTLFPTLTCTPASTTSLAFIFWLILTQLTSFLSVHLSSQLPVKVVRKVLKKDASSF